MGLKLHGEDAPEVSNLTEVIAKLNELDDKYAALNNGKKPDSFQIEMPDLPDMPAELAGIREEIRERLIILFIASAKSLIGSDGRPLMRDYVPIPGKATPYFDRDDLGVLADDVRSFLDPENPHFSQALTDREVGAIKLLGHTLNFAIEHGDPRSAFKFFARITGKVRLNIADAGVLINPAAPRVSLVHDITSFPWNKNERAFSQGGLCRKDILRSRLNEMLQVDYRLKNQHLVEGLRGGFPQQEKLWTQLAVSYDAATLALKVDDFYREQWFYILFSNLAQLKRLTRVIYDGLVNLARQIRTATEPQQISGAIDTFVQQTLSPFLAAQKTTSSPPSEPGTETPAD